MTTVTLAGIASSTAIPELEIIQVRRQLVGARRDQFVEVPGRPGSWVFPEEPGDRTIVVSVDIGGTDFDNRRDAVRRLADWADTPAGTAQLIVDDESDRFYDVMLITAPDVNEWLLAGTADLEYRSAPYAGAIAPTVETASHAGSPNTDTFSADDETYAYPVIEITSVGGILTGLDLTFGDDTITWEGTRAAGTVLTISSISDTITLGPSIDEELTGAYDPDALDLSDADGRFPLIIPGDNTYTLATTGTNTGVDISITWRRRYR